MSVVSQALIHKYARERAEQGSVDAETVANLLCDQADLDSTQALAQMLSSKTTRLGVG